MISYHADIAAWSEEQAAFLLAGRFDLLDLENLADEIASVGISELRELTSRLAVLLAHLLKCQYQPERAGSSWALTIKVQRKAINAHLRDVPSLKPKLTSPEYIELVWADTLTLAFKETSLDVFPETCPWSLPDILTPDWLP